MPICACVLLERRRGSSCTIKKVHCVDNCAEGMEPMVRGQRTTPKNTGRRAGGQGKRRLCSAEVANQVVAAPSPLSFSRSPSLASSSSYRSPYRPNQSLYDGHYEHNLSDDSDVGQENIPHNDIISFRSGPEIVKMIQEQQHILQQVLDTQKQMQLKQKDFDDKLEELKKTSESSLSSPESKKKFKISRKLTVSVRYKSTGSEL